MALLNKKYRRLEPSDTYLSDKVVLAQAWKKSHQYIRSTNWYADTFELDRSAIDLDAELDGWVNALKSVEFSFDLLVLVPAPKASCWHFETIAKLPVDDVPILKLNALDKPTYQWLPKIEEEEKEKGLKPLRPLAHVSIRDQSLMAALMMCLANKVETEQGDTSTDFEDVHKKQVVSYGNRLYCQFENGKADFSWGNSTCYSKYFVDYQKFLSRPLYFGYEALQGKINNEYVYEVHLDLEKFYDKVKRPLLIEKIKSLIDDKPDAIVNRLLSEFGDWKWTSDSSELYNKACSKNAGKIPEGIPQGLVAGGFFANVYLLGFDCWVAKQIGQDLAKGIRLVDCCRYVDDMRLILVADKGSDLDEIKKAVKQRFLPELKKLGLTLNNDKTRIEKFRLKRTGISLKLTDIQRKMSGPLSINEIDEQLGHLEGLIALAENLRNNESDSENDNPLAQIEVPSQDVREDTLLRFSANKIHTLLKQKRSLISQNVDEEGTPIAGSWDYLQERMARKFIACWSNDPSLAIFLKKGLELFPDKRILHPVISQLLLVMKRKEPKQRCIAEYCLCEVFRHAATVIHNKERWASPAHAEIERFFEYLQELAVKVIDPSFSENDYLRKQARFFLLVRNDSPLELKTGDKNFDFIIKMIKGFRNISAQTDASSFIANSLLAYQLGHDRQAVLRSVNAFLEKLNNKTGKKKTGELCSSDIETIGKRFAVESIGFFTELALYAKSNDSEWVKSKSITRLIEKAGIYCSTITGDLKRFSKPVSLLAVIKRQDNPFAHENALLALLKAALTKEGEHFEKDIDLLNCKVSCKDWSEIQSLNVPPELSLSTTTRSVALYPIPEWVSEEHKPLYRVGIFIRSCLLGKVDWSAANLKHTDGAGYFGLKSSFYKRQLGMMHSPEAIRGECAPMSGWFTGLLFHLLQWPGLKPHNDGHDWPQQWNVESLLQLIEERLEYQKKFYCYASKMPAYVERVDLGWKKDKQNLKVVMVQSLLPFKGDFSKYGLMLDTPSYRAKHRRHVAAVAELLLHKIVSQNSVDDEVYNKKSNVDLIVWPELAVHHDDMDILKSLSSKTGAMIFSGLTFAQLPRVKGPNNVAKWIIPKKQGTGRQFISRLQGKQNMTADEVGKIQPWRPYQLMIELVHPSVPTERGFILTGSICYDATDIKLSSDLKNKSNAFIVPALNKDVLTFDSMIDALYYHMYQHVVLVNTGEFGGSVAKAPYKERHDKLITHVHGANQVSISSFEMNMFDFRDIGKSLQSGKAVKTRPAG